MTSQSVILLMFGAPVFMIAALFISAKIVLKYRLTSQSCALALGMAGVPLVLAGVVEAILLLNSADRENQTFIALIAFMSSMLGGWIGASVAFITNQKKSGSSASEQPALAVKAQPQQPRLGTIQARLRENHLPDTASNVRSHTYGSAFVLLFFVCIFGKMNALGLWTISDLSTLSLRLRLLGLVLPLSGPALLYAALRKRIPALGLGLRDGLLPLVFLYVPWYLIFNLIAGFR